jgi:hypothetical protein
MNHRPSAFKIHGVLLTVCFGMLALTAVPSMAVPNYTTGKTVTRAIASPIPPKPGIPLESILKPEGNSASANSSAQNQAGVNLIQWAFNVLFVLGLGVLVMKQSWFSTWAQRVRELHEVHRVPVGLACFKALRLNHLKPSRLFDVSAFLFKPPTEALSEPEGSSHSETLAPWCKCLGIVTLSSGTQLHYLEIHGTHYVLTETATHSHWLACPAPAVEVPPVMQGDVFQEAVVLQPVKNPIEPPQYQGSAITTQAPEAPAPFSNGVSQPALPRSSNRGSALAEAPNGVMDAQTFFARHSA